MSARRRGCAAGAPHTSRARPRTHSPGTARRPRTRRRIRDGLHAGRARGNRVRRGGRVRARLRSTACIGVLLRGEPEELRRAQHGLVVQVVHGSDEVHVARGEIGSGFRAQQLVQLVLHASVDVNAHPAEVRVARGHGRVGRHRSRRSRGTRCRRHAPLGACESARRGGVFRNISLEPTDASVRVLCRRFAFRVVSTI